MCRIPPTESWSGSAPRRSDSDSKSCFRIGYGDHGQAPYTNYGFPLRQCKCWVEANVRNCFAVGSLLVLICADALRADDECGGPSWRILRCSRSRPRSIGTYELLRRASSAMNALLMKAASALHMANVISADVVFFHHASNTTRGTAH